MDWNFFDQIYIITIPKYKENAFKIIKKNNLPSKNYYF